MSQTTQAGSLTAPQCHIISFGYDTALMSSRTLLLQHAGFTVEEAYSPAQVLRLVRNDVVDMVVICHTVPLKEQEQLIAVLTEVRELLPVICIAASEYELGKAARTDCVNVQNSPVPLINAIRSIMIRDALGRDNKAS
jgi:DNA-binding NtrC family response regulator